MLFPYLSPKLKTMEIYLVTTDHLESAIWFWDEADFKVGMNAVPLIAASAGVIILAFILMSNHVHFVILGTYDQVLKFITEYKRHYSHYMACRHGVTRGLKRNAVDIRRVEIDGESMERAIAYVQMNPVVANICLNPYDYPWGTGNSFFNVSSPKGVLVESLSARARYNLFHSRMDVPEGLLLGADGYILPESYVGKKFVEGVFKSPKRMKYFLDSSSKAKRKLEAGESEVPAFKDQAVLPMMQELIRKLFGKGSIKELTTEETAELFRQMHYRLSSNINQMARLSGYSYEQIVCLMESL